MRSKVTVRVPDDMAEHIAKVCAELTSGFMAWNTALYLRWLIQYDMVHNVVRRQAMTAVVGPAATSARQWDTVSDDGGQDAAEGYMEFEPYIPGR